MLICALCFSDKSSDPACCDMVAVCGVGSVQSDSPYSPHSQNGKLICYKCI